jgi:hypothetical protein
MLVCALYYIMHSSMLSGSPGSMLIVTVVLWHGIIVIVVNILNNYQVFYQINTRCKRKSVCFRYSAGYMVPVKVYNAAHEYKYSTK